MTSTSKIPAVCVTIARADGPVSLCGETRVFAGLNCWEAARAWLVSQSATFPSTGGYDKHDFTVVFGDGETYEGRLDCQASGEDCDVQAHVRSFVRYLAGLACPDRVDAQVYARSIADDREEALAFLAKYDLG